MAFAQQYHQIYVYVTRREGKKVHREYIPKGPVADLAAALLRARKRNRAILRDEITQEFAHEKALRKHIDAFTVEVKRLFHVGMNAGGYHQHDHGEWRKRQCPSQR